jgi:hypothetical protein
MMFTSFTSLDRALTNIPGNVFILLLAGHDVGPPLLPAR